MARDSVGPFGKLWEESPHFRCSWAWCSHSRESTGCESKSSGSQPAGCVCFDTHLLSPVARTVSVYLLRLSGGSYGKRKSVCGRGVRCAKWTESINYLVLSARLEVGKEAGGRWRAKDAGILGPMEELRGTSWYKAASTHVQRQSERGLEASFKVLKTT